MIKKIKMNISQSLRVFPTRNRVSAIDGQLSASEAKSARGMANPKACKDSLPTRRSQVGGLTLWTPCTPLYVEHTHTHPPHFHTESCSCFLLLLSFVTYSRERFGFPSWLLLKTWLQKSFSLPRGRRGEEQRGPRWEGASIIPFHHHQGTFDICLYKPRIKALQQSKNCKDALCARLSHKHPDKHDPRSKLWPWWSFIMILSLKYFSPSRRKLWDYDAKKIQDGRLDTHQNLKFLIQTPIMD